MIVTTSICSQFEVLFRNNFTVVKRANRLQLSTAINSYGLVLLFGHMKHFNFYSLG